MYREVLCEIQVYVFCVHIFSLIMDFSSLALQKWIEQLKCTICNNYLSYFPIHTSSDGNNVCGRCQVPPGSYFRNGIYEVASQDTAFPCRYKSEGCCEILMPISVRNHEEVCEYRATKCLTQAFTKCDVNISYLNMTKHCHEQHSKYFLKDGEFEMDITKSQKYNYILEHNNQILILCGRFKQETNLFRFALSRSSYHKLKFSCGSKTMSIKWEGEISDAKNIQEICLDSLIGPQEAKISAKIYLGANDTTITDFNQHLTNLWKCSSCSNYAQKFYNDDSCPNCENSFHSEDTSIYTKIDILATLINFSCKNANAGCNFTGRLPQTEDHQKLCHFGSRACPLRSFVDCDWTGQDKSLESHFRQSHYFLLVNSPTIIQNITYDCHNFQLTTRCYVLRYSHYFFNLFYFQQDQKIYWIMQMMGEFKDIFKYEIEICDDTKRLPQFVLTQSCCKQSSKQELLNNLNNHCYVSLDHVSDCFKMQGSTSFKVRILKK